MFGIFDKYMNGQVVKTADDREWVVLYDSFEYAEHGLKFYLAVPKGILIADLPVTVSLIAVPVFPTKKVTP